MGGCAEDRAVFTEHLLRARGFHSCGLSSALWHSSKVGFLLRFYMELRLRVSRQTTSSLAAMVFSSYVSVLRRWSQVTTAWAAETTHVYHHTVLDIRRAATSRATPCPGALGKRPPAPRWPRPGDGPAPATAPPRLQSQPRDAALALLPRRVSHPPQLGKAPRWDPLGGQANLPA